MTATSSSNGSNALQDKGFGARVHSATAARGPLCVGIDPHRSLLEAWGLNDDAAGLERFVSTVVEALGDRVAVFKPQSAFFERHGSKGIAVLERLLRQIRAAGALSLLDVKRGDIGSTLQGYAQAYLEEDAPLRADAITASPYLGFGSLRPLFETARANGTGVFVLAATSNPERRDVQDARTGSGRTVAATILHELATLNSDAEPLGSFGAVVGATVEPDRASWQAYASVNGPLLAPGLGAQGGTPKDLRALFGPAIGAVLPSTSRGVLAAGPSVAGLRDAVGAVADELAEELHAPAS